jgi:putative endonuclease
MKYEKYYFVYINTNKFNKILYTGVTNNLLNRNFQHTIKNNQASFTTKYNVNKLVYYETFSNINGAIAREKQIKGWTREKKLCLIREMNPGWKDLIVNIYK